MSPGLLLCYRPGWRGGLRDIGPLLAKGCFVFGCFPWPPLVPLEDGFLDICSLLYANQKAVSDMRPGLCLALVKDQLSNTSP